jgi:murein DD-endopeptidase MepM/ murein hydrolase activator NlpD
MVSERGVGGAAAVPAVALALLVAACAPRVEGPAPVVSATPTAAAEPERITVRPGQTLSGIAHAYHVPMRAIAEANHLLPPYRIEIGRTLIIPQAAQLAVSPATTSPGVTSPVQPAAVAVPDQAATVPVERTILAPAQQPSFASAVPPSPVVSAPSPGGALPYPEAKPAAAAPAPPAAPEPPHVTAAPPSVQHSGTFLWPVRGRVVAGYGSGHDGTRNDGINIAAPRGAAVEATDAGVVAYAGNELRGYGNLILVKHSNGWISAYAHCDLVLVKRGDKVARGQVIARVGSTGNVSEPQLHFELRRGNRAVDPREFLAPLPTAWRREGSVSV